MSESSSHEGDNGPPDTETGGFSALGAFAKILGFPLPPGGPPSEDALPHETTAPDDDPPSFRA